VAHVFVISYKITMSKIVKNQMFFSLISGCFQHRKAQSVTYLELCLPYNIYPSGNSRRSYDCYSL
jgi:hypothetical protein